MNCLKRNLNVKNININIKHLRKTNRPLINKSTPALHLPSTVNPKQVI